MTAPAGRLPMAEDDVLQGLLDALKLAGWRAWHLRRSDKGLWMGDRGWPDITAVPPTSNGGRGPVLVLEVKSAAGRLTDEQATWLVVLAQAGVTAAVIRPDDYDRALFLVLRGVSDRGAWAWAFHP